MPTRPPLTINETCKALGVSDSTVRRMLTAGQLREQAREPGGRILIDPDSVDAAAVGLGRAELAGGEVRRELAPSMTMLAEVVSDLTSTIQSQQHKITELAMALGEARAEVRLLPKQAEAAEQRAASLEAELERTRADLETARRELDTFRRGAYSQGEATKQDASPSLRTRITRMLKRD